MTKPDSLSASTFRRAQLADSRYDRQSGTALYQLDGSGEIQLPANASQESSWAKANWKPLGRYFAFFLLSQLISRGFSRLAVSYQKTQPNASAAPAAAFPTTRMRCLSSGAH
ncbi:MAG: hypothetical protein ACLRVN_00910 [Butyricicoccus sp.]